MKPDLIERLRRDDVCCGRWNSCGSCSQLYISTLVAERKEAADEIERLRSDLQRLKDAELLFRRNQKLFK